MNHTRTSANLLVGCSVIGPKHVEKDLPNQDSYAIKRLNNDRSVIAVADGLGEADHAHEGSKLATSKAVNSLKQKIDSIDDLNSESVEKPIKDAIKAARAAIIKKAESTDIQVQEFETTLLVAVIGPTGAAGAVVGDGGIVCNIEDGYELLVEREEAMLDLGASHITIPVMQDNWEESYRFNTTESCSGIAVFSDGLEEFTWEGADANPDFFDSVFALVRDHDDPDPASETLSAALQDHPYEKFGDDKTIVVGDLPPTYGPDEVQIDEKGTQTLGDKLDQGNSSAIFSLDNKSKKAVRIFSPSKRDDDILQAKIEAMTLTSPPNVSSEQSFSLAWPLSIVKSTDEKEFLGYQFPLPPTETSQNIIEAADHIPSENNNQIASRTTFLGSFFQSFRDKGDDDEINKYEIALNLAKLVTAVHQQNHAFAELRPEKFLVDRTHVYATECTDLHVQGPEGTYEGKHPLPDYTPPNDSTDELSEYQKVDVFGLAILIFQIVMEGFHPFEACGSATTDGTYNEMISNNEFPYRDPQAGKLEPPEEAPAYDELPETLQDYFNQIFIEGKLNPDIRPSAADWAEVIGSVVENNE